MEIEEERAKIRMSLGGKGGISGEGQEIFPDLNNTGQTRDIVGQHLGMSGKQVEKLIAVVKAIDEYRMDGDYDAVEELRETLNTQSVTRAFNQVQSMSFTARSRCA